MPGADPLMLARLLTFVLAAATLAVSGCRRSPHPTFPDAPVVLVSIDTLRADHLPAWGHAGIETPAIDALRRDSVLFENAYAHGPLTLPSHATVLTGRLPPEHGVRDNLGYRLDAGAHPTIARLLKARGYATGAAVSAYVLRAATGLGDSFDFYDDDIRAGSGQDALGEVQRSGALTADRLLEWRRAHARGRPELLFLHLYEPHAPYEPPAPFDQAPSPYDGEIQAADAAVGRFLDGLRRDGVYDRAIVVLFSDHGEGLMEHGERHHGILLYRWALHVPLLLKLPGGERGGTTVRDPVGLVDVVPTLARLLDLAVPTDLPGRSLLEDGRTPRGQYAETYYPRLHLGWSELRSLVDGTHQWIDGPRPELYDIRDDPRQLHDLAATETATARSMREKLLRYSPSFQAPGAVSAEDRERLAALGYLGGVAADAAGPLPNPRDHIGEVEEVEAAFRLTKQDDDEAVLAFRSLLERYPRLMDVRLGLAEALSRLGRYEEAASAYTAILALAPEMHAEIGTRLARVSLVLGRMEEVETHARAGLETSPAEARELLAWAALGRGDLASAETHARAARELAPESAGSALALSEVHVRRSELEPALAVLDRARSLSSGPVRGLDFARGDVLARLGRHAEAAAAFEKEIEAFPTNSDAWARLAIVYAIQGRRRSEVARLLEAMHAASPGPETARLAAETLASIGDAAQAEQWRRRAHTTPP